MSFLPDVDGRAFGAHHLFFEIEIIIHTFRISMLIRSSFYVGLGMEIFMYFVIFHSIPQPELAIVLRCSFKVKMYNIIFFIARLDLRDLCASFTLNRVPCTLYHPLCALSILCIVFIFICFHAKC